MLVFLGGGAGYEWVLQAEHSHVILTAGALGSWLFAMSNHVKFLCVADRQKPRKLIKTYEAMYVPKHYKY